MSARRGAGPLPSHAVSDRTHVAGGPAGRRYRDEAVGPDDILGAWLALEPLPGSRLAAHTLLLFELEGDRLIGLSIEARREAHESCSAWRGLWDAHELSSLWATAGDLLTRGS